MPETNPIHDAELAELRRLLPVLGLPQHAITLDEKADGWIRPEGDAELGNWRVAKFAWADEANAALKLINAFPGILARLEEKEFQLSIQTASASMRGRSLLATYEQIEELQERLEAAERERDALAARAAQQRREGAAEWLEALIAAHRAERPFDPFVPLTIFETSAKRLRERGE